MTEALDNYEPTSAARNIQGFIDSLSNWYVRRNRRRFWKSENDADKTAAYTTLHQCLVTLSQLLAPFTPFIAEELYQNLVRSVAIETKEIVHLTDFPLADEAKIDDKLNREVNLIRRISSLGRAARAKAGIKVRQPLAKAIAMVETKEEAGALVKLAAEIKEEINVKNIEFSFEESFLEVSGYSVVVDGGRWVAINTELTPELTAEGISRGIVRYIQVMRRAADFDVAEYIVAYYQAEDAVKRVMVDFADYIKRETLSQELVDGLPPDGSHTEKYRVSGNDVLLAIKRVG